MSKPIVLTTKHRLGIEGAKSRITERYEMLKQTVKIDRVGDARMHWDGDTAHVSARALAQRVTATIAVTEHDLTITVHLPMILAPFRVPLIAFLEKQEDTVKRAP